MLGHQESRNRKELQGCGMRCGNVQFPIGSAIPPGHRSPGRPSPCWGLRVCILKTPGVDGEGLVLLPHGRHVETDLIAAGADPSQNPGSEILRYVGTLVYFGPPRGLTGTRLRDTNRYLRDESDIAHHPES